MEPDVTAIRSWIWWSLSHPWRTLATFVVLLAGGFATVASGIVPIKASAGHWGVTEWLLHFAMERSVSTHASPIDAPPLDSPALIKKGATHYDRGCSPCHGHVDGTTPRIPLAMLPFPKPLPSRVSRWQPEETYWIIENGLKFTGMPAWPAQERDDEVWAVVAFLRRFPELELTEYRQLAGGQSVALSQLTDGTEISEPRIVRDNCARCHGVNGQNTGDGAFPRLAGQRAEYMDRALRAYADGRRYSGIMGPIAASLSVEDRGAVVQHYASIGGTAASPSVTDSSLRGQRIAMNGVDVTMIPACVECHGPTTSSKNPAYPRLAGQRADYLREQLHLMKRRQRGGSEYVELMHAFVDRLTAEQIDDVTAYFASLSDM